MTEEKLQEQINVKVSPEEKRDFLQACERYSISQSELGRIALKQFMKDLSPERLLKLLGSHLGAL